MDSFVSMAGNKNLGGENDHPDVRSLFPLPSFSLPRPFLTFGDHLHTDLSYSTPPPPRIVEHK